MNFLSTIDMLAGQLIASVTADFQTQPPNKPLDLVLG